MFTMILYIKNMQTLVPTNKFGGFKMKKLLKGLTVALVGGLLFTACNTTSGGNDSSNMLKAGMVTDSGGVNDKSFNQGTYEGMKRFVDSHKDTWTLSQAIESKTEQDFEPNLSLAASKNKVVVASGYLFEESIQKVAKANPQVNFIGIDLDFSAKQDAPENILVYSFAEEEAGYLAGIAAAKQTKTNKIAYLGGQKVPAVEKFGWGYIAGAQSVNPDINITFEYVGSFKDAALGAQKAGSLYNNGTDVIFVAAGGTGTGVISEAQKLVQTGKEVWVIGVDRNQYEDGLLPDKKRSVILTSAVKKVDVAAEEGLKKINDKTFKAGTIRLTIKENAVGIPEENPNLSDDAKQTIDQATKDLSEGKVKAPSTREEVKSNKVIGEY